MGTWFWESYGVIGGSWMRRATCSSLPRRASSGWLRNRAQVTDVVWDSTYLEIIASEQIRRDLAWREPGSWYVDPPAGLARPRSSRTASRRPSSMPRAAPVAPASTAAARRSRRRRLGPVMSPIRERVRRSARLRGLYAGIRIRARVPIARRDHHGQARGRRGSRPGAASGHADPLIGRRVPPEPPHPDIAPAGTFGGIRTALDLFDAIATGRRPADRDDDPLPADAASVVPGYRPAIGTDDSADPAQVVSIDPATGTSLAIGPRDVFVATFWTTAELAVRLRHWQATTFGHAPEPGAYVIQDYEPGFYPMSAQSELARATYSRPNSTVAIFNTSLLQEAFHAHGIRFDHEFAFEPRIPRPLRTALAVPAGPRRRTIVVYGRPRTPRNASRRSSTVSVPGEPATRRRRRGRWSLPGSPMPTSTSGAASGFDPSASSTSTRTPASSASRRSGSR